MSGATSGVQFSQEEIERSVSAIADVLCWFRGFNAAHHGRDSAPDLPPDLGWLRELRFKLEKGLL